MTNEHLPQDSVSSLRRGLAAGFALLSLPIFFYTFVLDQWDGVTAYPAFDGLVFAAVGVLALVAFVLSRSAGYLLLPAILVLELLFVNVIDFSPVKPAKRALSAIKPGMTESQVRAIFDSAFPKGGRFRRPELAPTRGGVLSFLLDPTDGRYNAAIVEVTFRDGTVLGARFLAD